MESVLSLFLKYISLCCLQEEAQIKMKAEGVDKKDFFGKSDPFLVFYKVNEDGM